MKRSGLQNKLRFLLTASLLPWMVSFSQTQRDVVQGNLIQFNDNGAWCWYQDERAVIDSAHGMLILGSEASSSGVGGPPRSGDVETVTYDLASGLSQMTTLREGDPSVFYADDHNAPAFLLRPDGNLLAFYAAHFGDTSSYFRLYSNGTWGPEQRFNWKQRRPGGANFQTTYSNLFSLSAEGRMYNFVRGNNKSPNFMVSTDMGNTWTYGGQLTTSGNVGYNNGYYKYWSNGVDRIDFLFTEAHPRDFPTSIYHGYIKGGKSYSSTGGLADNDIFDTTLVPGPASFTRVFADSTILNGEAMRRCWNADVQRYSDGTIAAIITARANDNQGGYSTDINPEHRFLYCRFNGTAWTATYLGNAGLKLYPTEQDYTGLGALCPNNPNMIFLSTAYDPRTNAFLTVHEIFEGVTSDQGVSWSWTPVTENSVRDNLRPIVPAWDQNNTALLWWRGTYATAQTFDAAVVGVLSRRLDTVHRKIYANASLFNTTLADGSPLHTTGPDTGAGPADNSWHLRTGRGNGGSLFTSSETAGENAPELRTRVTVPQPGTYDVWINFWGTPIRSADWRIRGGLSASGLRLYRQMACQEVAVAGYAIPPVISGNGNVALYQAYLGRVAAGTTIDVFVDDDASRPGTTAPLAGDATRTWYDGVSYAGVGSIPAAPAFALSTAAIAFGAVPMGSSKTDTILVSNPGGLLLSVDSISATNARFTLNPATFTIAPSQTALLAVTFSPQDTTQQSGFIIFRHNAAGSPDTILVSGKGGSLTGVAIREAPLPTRFVLEQNYPNPFNPSTTMTFALPKTSPARLRIYDMLGQVVATLQDGQLPPGTYRVTWNAQHFASGMYFCRLEAGEFQSMRTMILLK